MRPLLVLLTMAVLGACSVGTGSDRESSSGAGPSDAPSSSPSPSPSLSPSSGPSPTPPGAQPDRSSTPACAEVRAGIDDFNTGDFEGTVAHFRTALPLARAQAAKDRSSSAQDLLAAVRYYADLAPRDYLRSAASSPQFARYKAITLGQCVAAGVGPAAPSESSPGVTA